jgi:hypothetical protein
LSRASALGWVWAAPGSCDGVEQGDERVEALELKMLYAGSGVIDVRFAGYRQCSADTLLAGATMRRATSLLVLAMLPLIVGVDASPVDDEGGPSGSGISCQLLPGKVVVAVSDHNGHPMKNESVRVSEIAIPEESWYSARQAFEKGSASTGDDGCAYITLKNVHNGKKKYYIWVFPRQYRTTRKGVTLNAATPEAAGVIRVQVKNKPRERPGGCFVMPGMT